MVVLSAALLSLVQGELSLLHCLLSPCKLLPSSHFIDGSCLDELLLVDGGISTEVNRLVCEKLQIGSQVDMLTISTCLLDGSGSLSEECYEHHPAGCFLLSFLDLAEAINLFLRTAF